MQLRSGRIIASTPQVAIYDEESKTYRNKFKALMREMNRDRVLYRNNTEYIRKLLARFDEVEVVMKLIVTTKIYDTYNEVFEDVKTWGEKHMRTTLGTAKRLLKDLEYVRLKATTQSRLDDCDRAEEVWRLYVERAEKYLYEQETGTRVIQ
jgi:hypothetical protein